MNLSGSPSPKTEWSFTPGVKPARAGQTYGLLELSSATLRLCAFAPLRLCENESSHSGGGSRKGAKTQRSQREDPGYVWTKFSKTISLSHVSEFARLNLM